MTAADKIAEARALLSTIEGRPQITTDEAALFDALDAVADLADAQAQENAKLKHVAVDLAASLAAAISLLERGGKAAKKAAPSDRMFDQMVADYQASLTRARAALTPDTEAGQ